MPSVAIATQKERDQLLHKLTEPLQQSACTRSIHNITPQQSPASLEAEISVASSDAKFSVVAKHRHKQEQLRQKNARIRQAPTSRTKLQSGWVNNTLFVNNTFF